MQEQAEVSSRQLLDTPLSRASLVSDVAERIRHSVVRGVLKPGEPIVEFQLSEGLGVSRGTVREAVRVLTGEGLLNKSPNQPARVVELTLDKSWEVYSMRLLLEGLAARVLAQRLVAEHLEQLNDIWERMQDAVNAADMAKFSDWDFALHEAMVRSSGHETLYQNWRRLSPWIRLVFSVLQYTEEAWRATLMSHRRVVDAIASRDPARAEAAVREDLRQVTSARRFEGFPELR